MTDPSPQRTDGANERAGKSGDPQDDSAGEGSGGPNQEQGADSSRDGPGQRATFRISGSEAAGLRISDHFPPLPRSLCIDGAEYVAVLDICVDVRGQVESTSWVQKADPELDQVLLAAVRSWQYRPRVVNGSNSPFCHPIKIIYRYE